MMKRLLPLLLLLLIPLCLRTPGGYDGSLPDTWIYLP